MTIEELNVVIRASTRDLQKQITDVKRQLSGMEKDAGSVQSAMTNAFSGIKKALISAGIAVGIQRIASGMASLTKEAMSVDAQIQNLDRTMGASKAAFADWAKSMAASFGISETAAIKYGNAYSNLISGFISDTEASTAYTKQLIEASAVIASRTGRTVEDVNERIRSGLLGSTEAIEDLGINVNVALLETTDAFKQLANGRTWEKLTFQEQQQVRLFAILEQSAKKFGTTLTSGGASSLLMFNAQLENLKLELGRAFLPIAQTVLPILTAFVQELAEGIKWVSAFFTTLRGESQETSNILQSAAVSTGTVSDNMADAAQSVKEMRRTLAGFDELNILSDDTAVALSTSAGAVSAATPGTVSTGGQGAANAFQEQVDKIRPIMGDILETALKIGGAIAAWKITNVMLTGWKKLSGIVLPLIETFNSGFEVGGFKAGMKSVRDSLTTVQKGFMGVAGGILAVSGGSGAGREFVKFIGNDGNVGSLLGSLASAAAGVGTLAIAFGAPGAAVGVGLSLVSAISAVTEAQVNLRLELMRTKYYDVQGESIDSVRTALTKYFESMDFDKQAEWIKTIEDAEGSYEDASSAYDEMWKSIAGKPVFDASDIEGLTAAFKNLASAAKSVNDAKIGSLMSGIKTSIEMNITPALTEQLGSLLDKFKEAQRLIGGKISGLTTEYQKILDDIAANGGTATAAQKNKLSGLRDSISRFTLTDDTSTERWNIEISDALKGAVNAGANKNEVISNIEDLMGDRDTYLNDLKEKYAKDMDTLKQLIDLDKKEFGGQLGFSSADISTLKKSYDAQISEVKSKYNEVLDKLIATYERHALNPDEYLSGNGFLDGVASIGAGVSGLFDWMWTDDGGWDFLANRELAKEQQEILKKLKQYRMSGYASGGFPSMGQMFVAREAGPELVGTIGGRTAVANNDQIVQAVAAGVYDAVVAAMSRAGSSSAGGDVVVQVDSREIARAAMNGGKRLGYTITV